METQDNEVLPELLTPDVTFHSPVVYKPFAGRKVVATLIPLLRSCFQNVNYSIEFGDAATRTLVAEVTIGELQAQNLQLLQFDADGLIADITVFLRPLRAGLALSRLLEPHLKKSKNGSWSVKAHPTT
ncbi:hypothetical protein [Amycolatopsis sp. NPDC051061]|uniref:hypothetical protein n=1 Tax=Amycolatopsis sp. NPDC051061 TaxID=3155042 RepID=UPI00343933C7